MKLGRQRKSHKGQVVWLALCLNNSVLNVKALVATLNQEKALEGAFSVIVKTSPINLLQL